MYQAIEQGGAPELAQLVSNYDNVYMPYVYHIYIYFMYPFIIYIYISIHMYIYTIIYHIYVEYVYIYIHTITIGFMVDMIYTAPKEWLIGDP